MAEKLHDDWEKLLSEELKGTPKADEFSGDFDAYLKTISSELDADKLDLSMDAFPDYEAENRQKAEPQNGYPQDAAQPVPMDDGSGDGDEPGKGSSGGSGKWLWVVIGILAVLVLVLAGLVIMILRQNGGLQTKESAAEMPTVTTEEIIVTEPGAETITELTTLVNAATIGELEAYTNLKELNLWGSKCYAEIADYVKRHPNVQVRYGVSLGGEEEIEGSTEELVLEPENFTVETLTENLPYMAKLKTVTFRNGGVTKEELETLKEAFPDITFKVSVNLLGQTLDETTESLDLSGLTASEVSSVAKQLPLLPSLTSVELMKSDGTTNLTFEDAANLQAAAPDVTFHFTFELWGKKVSTTDEEIQFDNKRLGEKEQELRAALSLLKGCKRFVLNNCGFSDELLAQVRDDFRGQTKVVWRINFAAAGSTLTDRTVLRYVYNLSDYNCSRLKYCEDAEYIDFGHNDTLTNCEWVAGMPHLKAIILSGSMVKDLSAFENCKELLFLELSNCGYLEDLSPIAACTSLTMLNIAHTQVADLSATDELPIEILVGMYSKVSDEELARFQSLHPDAQVSFDKRSNEYGVPWRYEKDPVTGQDKPNAMYQKLQEVFHYTTNPIETNW